MGAGLPVVASAIGSIPEYVQHEKTGLLFPAREHQALADTVMTLFSHKKLAHSIAQARAAYAKREFTAQRASKEVIDLYFKMLSDKR